MKAVVNVVTYGAGGLGGSLPAEETRRILLVQGDYWAVLDVDANGEDSVEGGLAEAFRTLRDLVEAGPEGEDRTEALTVLRSAYSTLMNPVTRGLYHAWRGVFYGPGGGGRSDVANGAVRAAGAAAAAAGGGGAGGVQRRRHLPEWLARVLRVPVLGVLVALLLTLVLLPLMLVVATLYCVWFLICVPFRMCADMVDEPAPGKKRRERCM